MLLPPLCACQPPPAPGGLRLIEAQSQESGKTNGAAPSAAATWRATTLPDNWDGQRPGYEGHVRYRLTFDTSSLAAGRLGVYLPAVGMNAYPLVNGVSLGAVGRMQPPVTRHFYTPLLWELPRGLLKPGNNELTVVVAGHPGYRCGLAPVEIGPYDSLYRAWQIRGWLQNTGTLVTSTLIGALGVYVLLLWLRERNNRVFGWFGLAAVVWGVRNLNYVITDPPLPSLLWSQLTVAGAAVFQGLFALFTLHYCESVDPDDRAPRWLAPALLAYMAAALVWFVAAPGFAQSRAGFVPFAVLGLAITAWSQWRLVRLAVRQRRAEVVAIAMSGLLYLALVLHDFAIARDIHSVGEVFLRQYASLPLFLSIGWMLTRRYLDALEEARSASALLQSRVEEQRKLLERNFQQLRAAEREQAQAAERDRVMRELHDGLGLHLITAYEQCQRAEVDRSNIAESLQDCLTDLRVAIDSLAPEERDPLAVLGSLRFRMAPRLEAFGMQLHWEVDGDVPELPDLDAARALHLLRLVQEALTNALRHSGAKTVTLRVEGQTASVTVIVRDDGRGFDPGRPGGRGLAHMRQRARQIGGQLSVRTGPEGSEVRLEIPVS
ncbi:sensor histidine kinase [Schlegelella sp. S2-27]|uniref:histidine kinase n=1 Tax=Caldimonas mangrovi TaxID=2944811 RepID=A0ABT0YL88_9BURK|nr:sensor histidine kinase [Caldimonas mangrovi]MCM5679485.1 sensor histidine kinase [Caldimonas mangrovi]